MVINIDKIDNVVNSLAKSYSLDTLVEDHNPTPESLDQFLINPISNLHIILLYEHQSDLDDAIITYVNEGLRKGQICVHASVSLRNEDYLENFSSKITNYQENIEKGNLMIVDLAPFYINAMVGNLESFDRLKEQIINIANKDVDRVDKHVRLTADCATLLLKNKHFNECINLENWWHQKPFQGSYICPYPKSLLKEFPYEAYLSRLFQNHDVIIDSNGKLIPEYMSLRSNTSILI